MKTSGVKGRGWEECRVLKYVAYKTWAVQLESGRKRLQWCSVVILHYVTWADLNIWDVVEFTLRFSQKIWSYCFLCFFIVIVSCSFVNGKREEFIIHPEYVQLIDNHEWFISFISTYVHVSSGYLVFTWLCTWSSVCVNFSSWCVTEGHRCPAHLSDSTLSSCDVVCWMSLHVSVILAV